MEFDVQTRGRRLSPVQLLRGQAALDAAREILSGPTPVPAVAVDPQARQSGRITVLAIASPSTAILVDPSGLDALGTMIAGCGKPLAAHEAKSIHRALLTTHGHAPSRWACTRLSAQLLAAGREVDLMLTGIMARHHLPAPPSPEDGFEQMAQNACAIAVLVQRVIPALKKAGMAWISKIEAAAVAPVAEMEHHGMPFDAEAWRALAKNAEAERAELGAELLKQFAPVRDSDLFGGAVLNLDSDAEVKAALRALGHPVPDMRRSTIAQLPEPIGVLLARFRELGKLTSTYGESFLDYAGADGRIHSTFEQIGASTGRMACHKPNLQAVVKDGPHRACFRCADHRRLVIGDYATCELRILAEMSGDPVFAEAFARGEDLHARVASVMFDKPVSKTENVELRNRAKAVNFGLAYGMGVAGLARAIDTDLRHAEQLLERYFQTFPKIRDFLEHSAREALERGYACTLTGRRLDIEVGPDHTSRSAAERVAKNMPIQGTSADIIKLALARLRARLLSMRDAWIVNAVHDEIVVECDGSQADEVCAIVAHEMEAAGAEILRTIPTAVDIGVGTVWDK
ncbi:MAG: DNA polymerase [Myxococcota bacterium]